MPIQAGVRNGPYNYPMYAKWTYEELRSGRAGLPPPWNYCMLGYFPEDWEWDAFEAAGGDPSFNPHEVEGAGPDAEQPPVTPTPSPTPTPVPIPPGVVMGQLPQEGSFSSFGEKEFTDTHVSWYPVPFDQMMCYPLPPQAGTVSIGGWAGSSGDTNARVRFSLSATPGDMSNPQTMPPDIPWDSGSTWTGDFPGGGFISIEFTVTPNSAILSWHKA